GCLRPRSRSAPRSCSWSWRTTSGSAAGSAAHDREAGAAPAAGPLVVCAGAPKILAMRVLVIEDDADAAEYLATGLREGGHSAEVAADGRDGLLRAASEPFDALIVDRMLPGLDGLSLVQHLRATGHTMPVLFLSALGEVDDRVKGLRAGGDDYLVKPYAFSELLARIENLGRRQSAKAVATSLQVADLELDLLTRKEIGRA